MYCRGKIKIYNEYGDFEREISEFDELFRKMVGTRVVYFYKEGNTVTIAVSGIILRKGYKSWNSFIFFKTFLDDNFLDSFNSCLRVKLRDLSLQIDDGEFYDLLDALVVRRYPQTSFERLREILKYEKYYGMFPLKFYLPKYMLNEVILNLLKHDSIKSIVVTFDFSYAKNIDGDLVFEVTERGLIELTEETKSQIEEFLRESLVEIIESILPRLPSLTRESFIESCKDYLQLVVFDLNFDSFIKYENINLLNKHILKNTIKNVFNQIYDIVAKSTVWNDRSLKKFVDHIKKAEGMIIRSLLKYNIKSKDDFINKVSQSLSYVLQNVIDGKYELDEAHIEKIFRHSKIGEFSEKVLKNGVFVMAFLILLFTLIFLVIELYTGKPFFKLTT